MARTRLTNPTPLVNLLYNPYQVSFLLARRLCACAGLCVDAKGERLTWSMLDQGAICPACLQPGIRPYRRFFLRAGRRGGKALDVRTPIPTPDGWRTMGDLHVGDRVFDEQGRPTRVTYVSPVYLGNECFRVEFSDHRSLIADGDHQWVTMQKPARKRAHLGPTVVTTRDIAASLHTVSGESNHAIVIGGALTFPSRALPIQPYTLGAWLGDGSSACADLTCSEPEIVEYIEAEGYATRRRQCKDKAPTYWLGGTGRQRDVRTGRMVATDSLHSTLRACGLLGNKHIPELYFSASEGQRLALLQGLMDADGQVNPDGSCEFDSTSPVLAHGVYRLVTELGGFPRINVGSAKLYGRLICAKWRVSFPPTLLAARLDRKVRRIIAGSTPPLRSGKYRFVTDVVPVPSVAVRCIQVEALSEMYLAGEGCIPTHNTRIGALSAIEESTIPYSIGWACAPSYPELEDYVLPAFFSQLPSAWFDHPATEWSEDRLSLTLPNKAQVHFRSLDDPNRGTGPGLDWVWIDEARKIQELAWDILRPALTEKKGIAFLTSSPEWGEDWTHQRFFVPAEEGRPGFWATTYMTVDNPIIDPAEVEEARQTMPPELFRREYEASIEYPTGTIYGDHLARCDCGDDQIREWLPEWPRIDPSRQAIVGIDPGTDHPFAAVLIVPTMYGLLVLGEYAERNKVFATHATDLKVMVGALQPRYGVDRSAKQAAIELAQHGIYAQTTGLGGPGSVAAGIQRVYAWMATGRLRIARSRCPGLLKELKNYRWAELQENPKGLPKDAIPFKKVDDLCDALRYAVMLWPELPSMTGLDGLLPGQRDLSRMGAKARGEIDRNRPPDTSEEGLIRVTDDFTPHHDEMRPLGDGPLSDFYR